jgi:hypothetical protein
MIQTYELNRNGLLTSLIVKDHSYDIVELSFTEKLFDEGGKSIIDSKHQMFFTHQELYEFLTPFINDMKARIENANSVQK